MGHPCWLWWSEVAHPRNGEERTEKFNEPFGKILGIGKIGYTSRFIAAMKDQLELIFARLRDTCDLANADFSDVNACSIDGDNGLHCVVRWGDLSAAKTLIDAGIDVNKSGDLGYTPLHVACMNGNVEMVDLLITKGADLFALTEGDPPFTSARLAGHDHICDLLGPLMKEVESRDPKIWVRARIAQLQRELACLERQL
jgi:ankyrin repeat protein